MPKNFRDRITQHINRRTTQSILRAFDYAASVGTPLNLYVVINLHEAVAQSAATLFERIRHKYRDWLNYRTKGELLGPEVPKYVYVMENPNDGHLHVNWAVYIPREHRIAFERVLPRWVERVQGVCGPYDERVTPIRQKTAKTLAKYVVKGTDPAYIEHFFLGDFHQPQGNVWGKRAGVSPSLGGTARKAADFYVGRRTYWRSAA